MMVIACSAGLAEDCHSLTMISSVELARREGDPRMYVPVSLQGTQKLMLLDTGGGVSEITSKVADELGLQRRTLGFSTVNLSDETSDQAARVSPFSIGRLKTDSIEFVVAPEKKLFGDDGRFAGILGPDILANYDIDIDFGAPRLAFMSPDHCEGKVIYWPASAVAIVPIRVLKLGHIVMTVQLDGKNVTAMLDTGAAGSTLTIPVAESDFGLKMGSADTPFLADLEDRPGAAVYGHRFKSLDFEGIAVGNLDVDIIPDFLKDKYRQGPGTGSRIADPADNDEFPDMLIGMNVLRHLHIYIAYKEKKLYITPAGASSTPSNAKASHGVDGAQH
jgi:predicted aspartyl protease